MSDYDWYVIIHATYIAGCKYQTRYLSFYFLHSNLSWYPLWWLCSLYAMIVRLRVIDSQTIWFQNICNNSFWCFVTCLASTSSNEVVTTQGRSDDHWWWLMIAIMKIFQKKLRYGKFNCQLVIRNEFPTNLWNFESKRVTTRKVSIMWFFTLISNKSWQQVSLWLYCNWYHYHESHVHFLLQSNTLRIKARASMRLLLFQTTWIKTNHIAMNEISQTQFPKY